MYYNIIITYNRLLENYVSSMDSHLNALKKYDFWKIYSTVQKLNKGVKNAVK